MGGKNTKVETHTAWDDHATLDQSSRIPYNTQVFQKYNNSIKALVDNLNPELSDVSFTELLNNTLPYNIKYENVVEEPVLSKTEPAIQKEQTIDTFADSPFLSPIKYANLLNSITSENIQQGGARRPIPKKAENSSREKTKKAKKANKPSHEIPDCNGRNNCERRRSDTSTTENRAQSDEDPTSEDSEDSEKLNQPMASDQTTSDEKGNNSDEEAEEDSEEAAEDSDEEAGESSDEEEPHGNTNFNTKYQSDSSNHSVRTSDINMIGNDSY
jgi:hypothetical protein